MEKIQSLQKLVLGNWTAVCKSMNLENILKINSKWLKI